jgi:hypothetical protein
MAVAWQVNGIDIGIEDHDDGSHAVLSVGDHSIDIDPNGVITLVHRRTHEIVTTQELASGRIRSIVKGNNKDLFGVLYPLYLRGKKVLDVTYGKGNFWSDALLLASMPSEARSFEINGHDYRAMPDADQVWDVVIYDPPYTVTGTKALTKLPEYQRAYGLDLSSNKLEEMYADIMIGLAECARITKHGGLVMQKCASQTNAGEFIDWPYFFKKGVEDSPEMQLKLHDEVVHDSGLGPQPLLNLDGSKRVWKRTHRAHSVLLIWKKTV